MISKLILSDAGKFYLTQILNFIKFGTLEVKIYKKELIKRNFFFFISVQNMLIMMHYVITITNINYIY